VSYKNYIRPANQTSRNPITPCCPYRMWRSPFLIVGPDEEILVHGCLGQDDEKVAGRCLGIGDSITHDRRRYRVVRRSADHGAVLKECGYAPAP